MAVAADYDYLLKVLLVGDSGVGKTSIVTRYAEGTFSSEPTIGWDFKLKNIKVGKTAVRLQLWDTGGQEKFRTVSSSYYRGAHIILFVYDSSDATSLQSVSRLWAPEVERYACTGVSKFLVANKIDVSRELLEDGENMAEDLGVIHLLTSAKTGEGLEELFQQTSLDAIEALNSKDSNKEGTIILQGGASAKKKGMCFI